MIIMGMDALLPAPGKRILLPEAGGRPEIEDGGGCWFHISLSYLY